MRQGHRQLIFHIGTHKTATTWLQHLLQKNEIYIRSMGVYYPSTGRVAAAHHRLAQSIWQRESKQASLDTIPLWRQLRDELAKVDEPTIVISSEEFEWVKNPQLIASFFPDDEIKVIVYLRRQDDYVESFYQQKVRDYRPRLTCSVREFIAEKNLNFLDYRALLKRWAEATPPDNILVRRFDRAYMKNGEIKDDFVSTAGFKVACDDLADPVAKLISHKASLGFEALEFIRFANTLNLTRKEHDAVVWHTIEASRITPGLIGRKLRLLDVATRINICKQYDEMNRSIAVEYVSDASGGGQLFQPVTDDADVFEQPLIAADFSRACLIKMLASEASGTRRLGRLSCV